MGELSFDSDVRSHVQSFRRPKRFPSKRPAPVRPAFESESEEQPSSLEHSRVEEVSRQTSKFSAKKELNLAALPSAKFLNPHIKTGLSSPVSSEDQRVPGSPVLTPTQDPSSRRQFALQVSQALIKRDCGECCRQWRSSSLFIFPQSSIIRRACIKMAVPIEVVEGRRTTANLPANKVLGNEMSSDEQQQQDDSLEAPDVEVLKPARKFPSFS